MRDIFFLIVLKYLLMQKQLVASIWKISWKLASILETSWNLMMQAYWILMNLASFLLVC